MGSFAPFTERVDTALRLVVPYAFLGLLFVLNVVAISFPLTGSIKAPLFLMGIYYWAIYRPTLVPAWAVFLAGLAMDLLSGLPLGINALIFVTAAWVISGQRRFLMGQPFLMIWIGFAFLCGVTSLMQWLILGVLQWHWFALDVLWAPIILGVALFPLVCVLLHLTHKILPAPGPAMRLGAQG